VKTPKNRSGRGGDIRGGGKVRKCGGLLPNKVKEESSPLKKSGSTSRRNKEKAWGSLTKSGPD